MTGPQLAALLDYVARPAKGMAGMSIDDVGTAASELAGKPIVIKLEAIDELLQGWIDCAYDEETICEWATLLQYGVHPSLVAHGRPRFNKRVEVPTVVGRNKVRSLKVTFDPESGAPTALRVLRDLQGARALGRHVELVHIRRWQRNLRAAAPEGPRGPRPRRDG